MNTQRQAVVANVGKKGGKVFPEGFADLGTIEEQKAAKRAFDKDFKLETGEKPMLPAELFMGLQGSRDN